MSLKSKVSLPRGRPFRFLARWTEHPKFSKFVKDNWSYNEDMIASLAQFTYGIKNWNKLVYGHIGNRKRQL